MDESGTDEVECGRKVPIGRMVAVAIRFLVNDRGLQLECSKVLHETLLVTGLVYEWRRRDQGLGLYMLTTSVCLVLGGWKESQMLG